MELPKIGPSPCCCGTALLVAVGVVLWSLCVSAEQLDVIDSLTHLSTGCPYLSSWSYKCGGGLYRAVKHDVWRSLDRADRTMSYDADSFACCEQPEGSAKLCSSWLDKGATLATCALADNYCPTLSVSSSRWICNGYYKQTANDTWWNKRRKVTVKLVGRETKPPFNLIFRCVTDSGKRWTVRRSKCNNPLLPDGLKYGLNKVRDDSIYVVGRNGPSKMTEGSFFRSFEVTTTNVSSDEQLWVWPIGSEWPKDETVVLAQMFNDDPAAATVQLSDIHETSFKLRLPHATCSAKHQKERINILQMKVGRYTAQSWSERAVVGKNMKLKGTVSIRTFRRAFAEVPVVFTQLQEVTKGPAHGYLKARIQYRSDNFFTAKLQQLNGQSAVGFKATAGYLAISAGGSALFFGSHVLYITGKGRTTPALDHNLNSREFGDSYFCRTPQVFVESQWLAEEDSIVERLVSSSALHAEFKMTEDSCDATKRTTHVREMLGLLAVGERLAVTKPEDCVLIFESKWERGVYLYAYRSLGGRPAYQSVSLNGEFMPQYAYYGTSTHWHFGLGIGATKQQGKIASSDAVCPHDGAVVTDKTLGGVYAVTGKVFRASPPTWTMCVPGKVRITGSSAVTPWTLTSSLTECARRVKGRFPGAAGADWNEISKLCSAVSGPEETISTAVDMRKKGYACLFKCNLLPGVMKNTYPRRSLGARSTAEECLDAVRTKAPAATGMTFADKGQCFAEYDGYGPTSSKQSGSVFCQVPTAEYFETPTTTTTTTTTTRTTTTTTRPATTTAAARTTTLRKTKAAPKTSSTTTTARATHPKPPASPVVISATAASPVAVAGLAKPLMKEYPAKKDITPFAVTVKDTTPVAVAVKDAAPVAVAVKDTTPVAVAVKEYPAKKNTTPFAVAVKDTTPVAVAAKDTTPVAVAVKDTAPVAVAVKGTTPVAVAVKDAAPVAVAVKEHPAKKDTTPVAVAAGLAKPPVEESPKTEGRLATSTTTRPATTATAERAKKLNFAMLAGASAGVVAVVLTAIGGGTALYNARAPTEIDITEEGEEGADDAGWGNEDEEEGGWDYEEGEDGGE